ncbi:Alcohol dehydrogenase [Gryllus bimaculatus]|nr:Alcohol dehydrogenase [Gryllus bimaculatus]
MIFPASVAICDVSSVTGLAAAAKFQKEFGAKRCFFVQADAREDAKMEAAFIATKKHFNRLDIFINSAGIVNDEDWNLCVDVNMKGIIRGTLLAWKHMGKQEGGDGGTVVNIASILGLTHLSSIPVYTATKHAVVGWGRACGAPYHVERTGVRVLTMCPGVTETNLIAPGQPKCLLPEILPVMEKELAELPSQKQVLPSYILLLVLDIKGVAPVAGAMLHLLLNAPSGSVWVSEGGDEPYEVAVPERRHMRVIP